MHRIEPRIYQHQGDDIISDMSVWSSCESDAEEKNQEV